jgi:hypothetical protein
MPFDEAFRVPPTLGASPYGYLTGMDKVAHRLTTAVTRRGMPGRGGRERLARRQADGQRGGQMVAPTARLTSRLRVDFMVAEDRAHGVRAPSGAWPTASSISLGRGPFSSRGGWPARSDVKAQ